MGERAVLIIGAGLAGLRCTRRLAELGYRPTVVEAEDAPGGRVRSDRVDGFTLDRGFQVLLTSYPAAREAFDYRELALSSFAPGAIVRRGGRFQRLVDPLRRPSRSLATLTSRIGSLTDKLRIARLRRRVARGTLEELFARPESTTRDYLIRRGLSARMIEGFFEPFHGGVSLDAELGGSSRMFEFTFRMFAAGSAALPAAGMGALARQLATPLGPEQVHYRTRVEALEPGRARTSNGVTLTAPAIVIATDATRAAELTASLAPARDAAEPRWRGVTNLYFDAPVSPVEEPMLVLNGERGGRVNNLAVVSDVAASFAPEGRHLISVSVLGVPPLADEELATEVIDELSEWYGEQVRAWRLLRIYRIERALPDQPPGALEPARREQRVAPGVWVAGDHLDHGSIQGALESGLRAAEAVHAELRAQRPG